MTCPEVSWWSQLAREGQAINLGDFARSDKQDQQGLQEDASIKGHDSESRKQWQTSWDSHGPGFFAKRLALIAEVKNKGSGETSSCQEPNPFWLQSLKDALVWVDQQPVGWHSVSGFARCAPPVVVEKFSEVRFIHAFWPFLLYLKQKFEQEARLQSHFNENARTDLLLPVAERLSELFHAVLWPRLEAQIKEQELPFDLFLRLNDNSSIAESDAPTSIYDAVVGASVGENLKPLFSKYPVLARLCGTLLANTLANSRRLAHHLDQDWDWICGECLGKSAKLPIVELQGGLSDPHHGGRSVQILTFASGHQLVYKPRSLAPELAFNQLLKWFADYSDVTMRRPECLDGIDHGWMEFVALQQCDTDEEVQQYYRRAGALVALAYITETVDLHQSNLIAAGSFPVLVDLEMIASPPTPRLQLGESPRFKVKQGLLAIQQALRDIDLSVLRSLLLPQFPVDVNGVMVSLNGLGRAEEPNYSRTEWYHVNTDWMHSRQTEYRNRVRHNIPSLRGTKQWASDYVDEVEAGFRNAYKVLSDHKELLLADGGPLSTVLVAPSRFLMRDTNIYAKMIAALCSEEMLRSAASRAIQIDKWLHFGFVKPAVAEQDSMHKLGVDVEAWSRPFYLSMVEQERLSLEIMDVPLFQIELQQEEDETSDSRISLHPDHSLRPILEEKVRELSQQDCDIQCRLITGSLRTGKDTEPFLSNLTSETSDQRGSLSAVSDKRLIEAAGHIAQRLQSVAILKGDGSAAWVHHKAIAEPSFLLWQYSGWSLYGGSLGIPIFLAALYRIQKKESYRKLALASLRPLYTLLENDSKLFHYWPEFSKYHGLNGAGGIVYALALLSEMLEITELLELTAPFVSRWAQESFPETENPDVAMGAAGLMLGMRRLQQAQVDKELDELTESLGRWICESQIRTASGHKAWLSKEGGSLPLTGFSHGASGIAFALSKLDGAEHDTKLRTAIDQALKYEDSLYDKSHSNWPDLREGWGKVAYHNSWSHGAVGIALARLKIESRTGIQSVFNAESIGNNCMAYGFKQSDRLGSGNFGRVEYLNYLGEVTGNDDYIDGARVLAGRCIQRAGSDALFDCLPGYSSQFHNVGFYSGLSGVGYTLLRLVDASLPNVLLWE